MTDDQAAVPTRSLWQRIGWRNIAYLGFVAFCLFGAALMEASAPRSDAAGRGTGFLLAFFLWALVSLPFFLWNAFAAIAALARHQPAGKAILGAALPVLFVIIGPALGDLLWFTFVVRR